MRKESKEDEQTLQEFNSAPRRLQAKCQLVQSHIINILLTELSRSVWENLDLGRVYRPPCVRSVLTTSVKILPYRPPAWLIRANYGSSFSPLRFMARALRAWAINRRGKNSDRNLRYGPRTRLVIGIYQLIIKITISENKE